MLKTTNPAIPAAEDIQITESTHSDIHKVEKPTKGRKLGDQWVQWDGNIVWEVDSPKRVFLLFALGVTFLFLFLGFGLYYLTIPRFSEFHPVIPDIVLVSLMAISGYLIFWYLVLIMTSYTRIKLSFLGRGNRILLGFLLENVFRLGTFFKYNRDRLGNSFVKVSNAFVHGTKVPGIKEKLLILLPRCLTKETYQSINEISKEYNVELKVCTGGEIARQKVKEFKPTAIIGVACERDLVSGIKDVGGKISVLGIPNIRPDGPCKNTYIHIDDLRKSIQFYLS